MISKITGLVVYISILLTGISILTVSFLLDKDFKQNIEPNLKNFGKESALETGTHIEGQISVYELLIIISKWSIWVFIPLYALSICCMYKDIYIAIKILKTTSSITSSNLYVIAIPIIQQILLILWVAVSLNNFVYLFSTGKITQPEIGSHSQVKTIEFTDE